MLPLIPLDLSEVLVAAVALEQSHSFQVKDPRNSHFQAKTPLNSSFQAKVPLNNSFQAKVPFNSSFQARVPLNPLNNSFQARVLLSNSNLLNNSFQVRDLLNHSKDHLSSNFQGNKEPLDSNFLGKLPLSSFQDKDPQDNSFQGKDPQDNRFQGKEAHSPNSPIRVRTFKGNSNFQDPRDNNLDLLDNNLGPLNNSLAHLSNLEVSKVASCPISKYRGLQEILPHPPDLVSLVVVALSSSSNSFHSNSSVWPLLPLPYN